MVRFTGSILAITIIDSHLILFTEKRIGKINLIYDKRIGKILRDSNFIIFLNNL
jgi:hypothetical protein